MTGKSASVAAIIMALAFLTSAHADDPLGCSVNGAGFIVGPNVLSGAPADGQDTFAVTAALFPDGDVRGGAHNVDHGTGNVGRGNAEYLYCRHVDEPGPFFNQAYFGGHAEWFDSASHTWQSGYWIDVVVKDRSEPGSSAASKKGKLPDTYHVTVRQIDDGQGSGPIVYETKGDLVGGNIQLQPADVVTLGPLPAWVSLEP